MVLVDRISHGEYLKKYFEDNGFDAGVANALLGLNRRKGFDLGTNIGRSIEQHPVVPVAADSDRRLGARPAAHRVLSDAAAVRTVAVPLREAASGSRS